MFSTKEGRVESIETVPDTENDNKATLLYY